MKAVICNPHRQDRLAGIHGYISEYLRKYRPAIQITSPKEMKLWLGYLKSNNLPWLGWRYVFKASQLKHYDVWMCFAGSVDAARIPMPPTDFNGVKLYHVMDYVYDASAAGKALDSAGIDYILAYAGVQNWCPCFRTAYKPFLDTVISWPFGYSDRFSCTKDFEERNAKCSVMGAVNLVDPNPDDTSLDLYRTSYAAMKWAHPIRQLVREHMPELELHVESYLPPKGSRVRLDYDSPLELNRHQLFLNDDSVMHFPPARTYEGIACGAIMMSRHHSCYTEYGFENGTNCFMGDISTKENLIDLLETQLTPRNDLVKIHQRSLQHAEKFSHNALADRLHSLLIALHNGDETAINTLTSWS